MEPVDRTAVTLRQAHQTDAGAVSAVILSALRETNARDYSDAVLRQVEASYTPAAVGALMRSRMMFVAVIEGAIVGTASLHGDVVRTVFVAPGTHGHGVGRRLMARVEATAREAGVALLRVPSSITAVGFYARLGYREVGEQFDGEERTIVMEREVGSEEASTSFSEEKEAKRL